MNDCFTSGSSCVPLQSNLSNYRAIDNSVTLSDSGFTLSGFAVWRLEIWKLQFTIFSFEHTNYPGIPWVWYMGPDLWWLTELRLNRCDSGFDCSQILLGLWCEWCCDWNCIITNHHDPTSTSFVVIKQDVKLDLKQQQYEGEVTNGSCGLIPQTKAAILIQIAIIIIITMIIVLLLMMMMMLIWDKVR